jgi:DNA processing protein
MGKIHWLALSHVRGIGGVTLRRLLERFGNVEQVLRAPPAELRRVPRVTERVVDQLRALRLEAVEAELAELTHQGLQLLTWEEPEYPAGLRITDAAPPVLYLRGELRPTDANTVAIVGTRKPTPEKITFARELARQLAQRGVTVVSGLARGIDTAAHMGALEADHGRTLAVPGSGLHAIHPAENWPLANEIARRGAVLSELRPGTVARTGGLMSRNRILGGLSRAVIVVEARAGSGSLDTALKAKKLGRTIFAVPGSVGTHALIALGAERLVLPSTDWEAVCQRLVAVAKENQPPDP